MINQKKQTGFTLVELLVFIGLFSILLLVLTKMFISIMDAQLESQASSGVSQNNRYILNRLMYDIHRANSLISPLSVGASATSLSLNIGSNYVYKLIDNNLFLSIGASDYRLNDYDTIVSDLQFQRLGNTVNSALIKVVYTIKSDVQKSFGTEEIKNVETVIGLRPN